MIWEDHSRDVPNGAHALFSGSQYAWTNFDMEDEAKFEESIRNLYYSRYAKDVGTIIHAWAADRIYYRMNVVKSDSRSLFIYIMNEYEKLKHEPIPRNVASYYVDRCFTNVSTYIKDAIGFRLDPEIRLKYANEFYGTADVITYKKGEVLRIHDLKTGLIPAKLRQLEVYAAFCCLEYGIDPKEIELIELRIYQNDEILVGNPPGEVISELMERIRKTRSVYEKIKKEG